MVVKSRALTGNFVKKSGDTMTGDLELGRNGLKTEKIIAGSQLLIRDDAETAYEDVVTKVLKATTGIEFTANSGVLDAENADSNSFSIRGRDSGVGLVEVAKVQGAADPYFQATLPMRLAPSSVPGTPVEGMLWYDSGAKRLKYYDDTRARNVGAVTRIVKASDETVNNSATYQNDDYFVAAVEANKTYWVHLFLVMETSITPDFKFIFTVPTSATIKGAVYTDASTYVDHVSSNLDLTLGLTVVRAVTPQFIQVHAKLIVAGTAGSLQLQWRQNTADASNTKVLEESFMEVLEAD